MAGAHGGESTESEAEREGRGEHTKIYPVTITGTCLHIKSFYFL